MDPADVSNVRYVMDKDDKRESDEKLIIAIEASFEIDPSNPILQEAFEYSIDNLTLKY